MCGIAVGIDWTQADEVVRRLISAIGHRGDVTDALVCPQPGSAFCTRRLKIVDPEHNRQPAVSWDGRILVAFNGEIYNYRALRAELAAAGVPFRTDGDTEVLAAALSVWGGRALQRLSGMFAFVAMDLKTGEFLAARDPLGVKPLYFLRAEAGWLFCSEIAPLLHASEEGDVFLLPPGAFLTRGNIGRHSTLDQGGEKQVAPPDVRQLDVILADAVAAHLPDDLPVASFFSGGIDSTLLAHYARRLRPEAPGFFLGDASSPDYPFAAAYADRSGLDLRMVQLPVSTDELDALLPRLVTAIETFEVEVVRDAYCNWLLAQAAHHDGYRVILAGEGADELFAGYRPLEVGFVHAEAVGRDLRQQTLDQMCRTNLQRLDRCAMRFQIEARVPFLDPAVVQAALSCGAAELVSDVSGEPVGKQPLRALYDLHSDALPGAIGRRRKLGLHIGSGLDQSTAVSPWRELAESKISDATLREERRRLVDFHITDKEELLYILTLEESLDIGRVPHLKSRTSLSVPSQIAAACLAVAS